MKYIKFQSCSDPSQVASNFFSVDAELSSLNTLSHTQGTDTTLGVQTETLDMGEYGIDNVGDIYHDDATVSDWTFKNQDLNKDILFNVNYGGADTTVMTLGGTTACIGVGAAPILGYKFYVATSIDGYAGYFNNTCDTGGGATGIFGIASGTHPSQKSGVIGQSSGAGASQRIGVLGSGTESTSVDGNLDFSAATNAYCGGASHTNAGKWTDASRREYKQDIAEVPLTSKQEIYDILKTTRIINYRMKDKTPDVMEDGKIIHGKWIEHKRKDKPLDIGIIADDADTHEIWTRGCTDGISAQRVAWNLAAALQVAQEKIEKMEERIKALEKGI